MSIEYIIIEHHTLIIYFERREIGFSAFSYFLATEESTQTIGIIELKNNIFTVFLHQILHLFTTFLWPIHKHRAVHAKLE